MIRFAIYIYKQAEQDLMDNQKQSALQDPKLNKSQRIQSKTKQVLLVVGKMGHGKSAFVNSLIRPKSGQQPQWIKKQIVIQQSSLSSVTDKCYVRKVNTQHQLNQNLWLIDTPGLDSEYSPALIAERIDNLIISQNYDLIGIAYVIDINVRQLGYQNHSVLKQFLKILKIQKQLKNKLVFFVLSKWDKLICNQQQSTVNNLLNQFIKLIDQIGIKDSQNKLIKWASSKQPKSKVYKNYLANQNGEEKVKKQWIDLRSILQQTIKSTLKFQEHKKNVINFWKKLKQRLFCEIQNKNIQYNQNDTKIDYDLQMYLRNWDIVQEQKNVMEVMLKVPVVNIFALFYGVTSWYMNKETKVLQAKSQLKIQQLTEVQYKKQIQSKLKSAVMLSVIENIFISKNEIIFDKIGEKIKITKLLTYYISELSTLHPLKVPITFLDNNDLKQKIVIGCSFQNKNQKQAQIREQSLVSLYKNNFNKVTKQIRIPKFMKFFVRKDQQKFILRMKAFCKLPKEQCFLSLLRQESIEMFGNYL